MPEEPAHINFTLDKVKLLRKTYDRAVRDGKQQFVFEGHTLLVSYVKHVLDYLEGKFE